MQATSSVGSPQKNSPNLSDTTAQSSRKVEYGDTLGGIAKEAGVSVKSLLAANPQIKNADRIYPGDTISIPARDSGGVASEDTTNATAATNTNETNPSTGAAAQPKNQAKFDYNMIAGVKGNPNVTPEFISKVEGIAQRLGAKPEQLMAVMSFESGGTFSPSIRNSIGATGLIQFIPSTARGLGTSTEALSKMSATKQLDYVEKYFNGFDKSKLGTVEGLYTSVLTGKSQPDPNTTLRTASGNSFTRGTPEYRDNAGLDFNKDGKITTAEAAGAVTARLYGGVTKVQQQLIAKGAVPANEQARFADGSLGSKTAAAITRFQQANGLPATGSLDTATGAKLFGLTNSSTPASTTPATPGSTSKPPATGSTPTQPGNSTTSSGALTSDHSLKRGSTGDNVKLLQDNLVKMGFMTREQVNTGYGTFGPKTEAALKAFQSSVGLTPSGSIGPQTKHAMESVMSGVGVNRKADTNVIVASQKQLVAGGYMSAADAKTESGTYGAKTEAAVKAFQAKNNIQQTGIIGQQTFGALNKEAASTSNGGAATSSSPTSGAGRSSTKAANGAVSPLPAQYSKINKADKAGEGDGNFGTSRGGGTRTHKGIDIEAPVGTPVYAVKAGTATVKNQPGGAGLYVSVKHNDGTTSNYFHLSSAKMKEGATFNVTGGQQIGAVGRSGNTPAAGDTHLHFEVRDANGNALDPTAYFPKASK